MGTIKRKSDVNKNDPLSSKCLLERPLSRRSPARSEIGCRPDVAHRRESNYDFNEAIPRLSTTMSTPTTAATPSVAAIVPPTGGSAAELMPPPPVPPSAQTGAPETASGQAAVSATTPASELATLRAHIQTLTELNNRLQAIRNIPALLLRPIGSDPSSTLLTHGFKEIAAIADTIRAEKVQDALQAARKSEQADSSGLTSNLRRETLKRRQVSDCTRYAFSH